MQLLSFLLSGIALGQAASAAPALARREWGLAPQNQPMDMCRESTFVNEIGAHSPLIYDCKVMEDFYRATNSDIYMPSDFGDMNDYLTIAQNGTCRFGLRHKDHGDTGNWYIGNTDIADLIHDSIRQFGEDGCVGATGITHCVGFYNNYDLDWKIF